MGANAYLVGWKMNSRIRLTSSKVEVEVEIGNDLCAIKQILYDIGPLTLVRWLIWRAFKV